MKKKSHVSISPLRVQKLWCCMWIIRKHLKWYLAQSTVEANIYLCSDFFLQNLNLFFFFSEDRVRSQKHVSEWRWSSCVGGIWWTKQVLSECVGLFQLFALQQLIFIKYHQLLHNRATQWASCWSSLSSHPKPLCFFCFPNLRGGAADVAPFEWPIYEPWCCCAEIWQ